MQLVYEGQHPLLVRHRDQNAGEISSRPCPGDEGGQVICLHLERDANGVYALFREEPIE